MLRGSCGRWIGSVVVAVAVLAAGKAHAGTCTSAAQVAADVWQEFRTRAIAETCEAPVSGPRRYLPCFVRPALNLAQGMIGWWNHMAANSWATIGPRVLGPEVETGTLVFGTARLFMTTVPVHTQAFDVELHKLDGRAKTEVTICAWSDDGTSSIIHDITIPEGADNIGSSWTWSVPVPGRLISVHIDNKSVAKEFQYSIQSHSAPLVADTRPVTGFADLHVHQVASLGYAGAWYFGAPDGPPATALRACSASDHAVPDLDLGRHGVVRHGHGAPGFEDWPRNDDIAHLQTHADWVKQAHDGGMSLMVASPVNFEWLCAAAKLLHPAIHASCDDMDSVDRQLDALIAFAEAHSDWYEIAVDPWHAREIIHAGKLAVVIAPEISDLFPAAHGSVEAQLDRWVAKGVRSLQLAHETDSNFAGAAPHDGAIFDVLNFLKFPFDDPRAGGVNHKGLTSQGAQLVDLLVRRHMPIDTAHLSAAAKRDLFQLLSTRYEYFPMYSSHTRFAALLTPDDAANQREFMTTDDQALQIVQTGGMIGLRTGLNDMQSFTPASPARAVDNDCPGSATSFAQLVLYGQYRLGIAMGFGSDLSGFITQMAPRFGARACTPFGPRTQPYAPRPSSASVEYQRKGLAHIGLLPELRGDLRSLGVDTTVLDGSAEAFLKMWERAWDDSRRGPAR